MVLYMIIAWYLDNVIPSVNGTSKPFYFLFLPSYWEVHILSKDEDDFLSPKSSDLELNEISTTQPLLDDTFDNLGDIEMEDLENSEFFGPQCVSDDEEEETETIPTSPTNNNRPAVQITNLTKDYSRSCFWPSSKDSKNAVSNLSLNIDKGTIFCLLGHNGAGKTTLFNMLTGVLLPTSGTAKLFDLDIQKQRESIREIMGVCPQHDLLWDDLTAWQHLEIFAELRGVPSNLRKQCIVDKLEEVELLHVNFIFSYFFCFFFLILNM